MPYPGPNLVPRLSPHTNEKSNRKLGGTWERGYPGPTTILPAVPPTIHPTYLWSVLSSMNFCSNTNKAAMPTYQAVVYIVRIPKSDWLCIYDSAELLYSVQQQVSLFDGGLQWRAVEVKGQ